MDGIWENRGFPGKHGNFEFPGFLPRIFSILAKKVLREERGELTNGVPHLIGNWDPGLVGTPGEFPGVSDFPGF